MSKLKGVPETMLITLWARAEEIKQSYPIIHDPKAAEIVSSIDYDFLKFKKSWLSQIGISVRTMLFDNAVKDFLERKPDSIIINIGAGLDTRYDRLKNLKIKCWYDLDLPEAIDLRRNFFNETSQHRFIASSVFDYSWFEQVETNNTNVLILTEGLLIYFTEEEVKALLNELTNLFPGAEILFDTISPFFVGKARFHDTVRQMDTRVKNSIEFKWGTNTPQGIETWNEKIRFIDSWNFYDFYRDRWSWFGVINTIGFFRNKLSGEVVHLRILQ